MNIIKKKKTNGIANRLDITAVIKMVVGFKPKAKPNGIPPLNSDIGKMLSKATFNMSSIEIC